MKDEHDLPPDELHEESGRHLGDDEPTLSLQGDELLERPDLPDRIGRYRVLGRLGEGGMGIVFLAEQETPKRQVAVKVIRGGRLIDENAVRMFQREAQTLARLKHTSIAPIYESGLTDDGHHFFAMELVHGETLDVFIANRPPVTSRNELRFRLAVFRKIADAVHYAHQRGVIHRDLKPSNIIITGTASGEDSGQRDGLPLIKILDFGLARIIEDESSSMMTEVGVIKGTLPYMSPEQARGNPEEIEVRSDVYALGVVLYEVLTGCRPYDLQQAALLEAIRVICEQAPRPLRDSMPSSRHLDADIETIVLKALEKEPPRRYASAAAMSDDIERYLTSQPILARPPSAAYQMRKFAARNRLLVGAALAVLLMLVGGVAVSTIFGLREARERRAAEQARADLEEVVAFQARMLSRVDPSETGRRLLEHQREQVAVALRTDGLPAEEIDDALAPLDALTDRVASADLALSLLDGEILGRAVMTIDEEFADRPLIAASLRSSIGETYYNFGLYEQARQQLEAAWTERRHHLGDLDGSARLDGLRLCNVLELSGKYEQALTHCESLYATHLEALGAEDIFTAEAGVYLAQLYMRIGRTDDAARLWEDALDVRIKRFGEDHDATLAVLSSLGWSKQWANEMTDAERYYRRAYEGYVRLYGTRHHRTLATQVNLAYPMLSLGRADEAIPLLEDALTLTRETLGSDHMLTLRASTFLAQAREAVGEVDAAAMLLADTVERSKRILGPQHPETLDARWALCSLRFRSRDWNSKVDTLNEALAVFETRRRILGPTHIAVRSSIRTLRIAHREILGYDAAVSFLENHISNIRAADVDRDRTLEAEVSATSSLAMALLEAGLGELALERVSRRADELRRTDSDRFATAWLIRVAGQLLVRLDRADDAESLFDESVDRVRSVFGSRHAKTREALRARIKQHIARQDLEQAETRLRELLSASAEAPLADRLATRLSLAYVLSETGAFDDAEAEYRACVDLARSAEPENPEQIASALAGLGDTLIKSDRAVDAEPVLREALAIRREHLPSTDWHVSSAISLLAHCLAKQRRVQEAERLHLEAANTFPGIGPSDRFKVVARRIVEMYEAVGRDADARLWRKRLESRWPLAPNALRERELAAQAPDATALAKNDYAWTLLVVEDGELRDPELALEVALAADEMSGHEDPRILGTLARAYFENGRVAEAIGAQKMAVSLLPDGATRQEFAETLARYEAGSSDNGAAY